MEDSIALIKGTMGGLIAENDTLEWLRDDPQEARPAQIWKISGKSSERPSKYRPIHLSSFRVIEPIVDAKLSSIQELIESSSELLELEKDWDGYGASPISKEAYDNASGFLLSFASWAYERITEQIPLPTITPGPDSSVELYWKTGSVDLLINFPATNTEFASFYGDDQEGVMIKGTFSVEKPQRGVFLTLLDQ